MNVYKELEQLRKILHDQKLSGKDNVSTQDVINQVDYILSTVSNDVTKEYNSGEVITLNGGLEYYYIGQHPMYPRYSCCLRCNTNDIKNIEIFDTALLKKRV